MKHRLTWWCFFYEKHTYCLIIKNTDEVDLNKQQYIRLSIVLAVPTLLFSFWLAQQDFLFNRGQLVSCSIGADFCYQEQMPLSELEEYATKNADIFIEHHLSSPESLLAIYDFNLPVKIYFNSLYTNEEIEVTDLINGKMLSRKPCVLSSLELMCENSLFPTTSSVGRIEFVYSDDEAKYNDIIREAKSHFEDYFLIRTAIGSGLFLSIAASYLVFSWLVHFIIYGTKIGSQKKRPYQ